MQQLRSERCGARQIARKLEPSIHMVNYISIYKGVPMKCKLDPPEPDPQQHDRPAGCVIAQQHSSVAFVLRCRHSRK